MNVTDRHTDR